MKEELQEAEHALASMMRSYFVDRDVEGTLRFVTEDVYSAGLGMVGMGTVALGREALRSLIQREILSNPEPYAIREERFDAKPMGAGIMILLRMRIGRPCEEDRMICQTACLQKEEGRFKVCATHISFERPMGGRAPMEELARRYHSERDALTGLYNTRQTEQMINRILRASSPSTGHAFFLIDMDHLKEVNDTCGHMAGDALLADCARQLSGVFRHDDVIGRIGGDEFVVFVCNIASPDFVEEKARQIGLALGQSAEQARLGVACTCSVGAALYPQDGQRFEQLYQRADIALCEAKRKGGNLFVFYDQIFDHGQ